MIVYSVSNQDDTPTGWSYHTTKREALRVGRMAAPCEVEKHYVADLPARELAVALLSHVGWAERSELVKEFPEPLF